jgi:hypothetical protein
MFSVGNGQCLCLMACVHFSHCGSDQLWSNLLYAYYFPPLAFCVLILCTAPIFIYIIYTYIYIIRVILLWTVALKLWLWCRDYYIKLQWIWKSQFPWCRLVLGWKSTSFDLFCFIQCFLLCRHCHPLIFL